MKIPKPATVDFETFGIEPRPDYPPKPVGVSIKYPGKAPRYYAWGHPTENNCTQKDAVAALKVAWAHKEGLLFQNGKFDVDVAETHLGLPRPSWELVHDSMFLLFLDDPHQAELSLKPSSERLLGMPPEEQDAVGEWLVANQPIPGVKISLSKKSDHYFGRYIAYAPGGLVGKYCNGDVDRTERLFKLLWPKTQERGMLEAYDRERQLMPILLDMERQGVPVDLVRLSQDVENGMAWASRVDAWIIKRLGADTSINLDSADALVAAMVAAGKADSDLLPRTATGKFQTNKEALLLGVTDPVLLGVLKYRTQLNTCMRTFMQPWLKTAALSNGLIFTSWNQTRGDKGGTRTGRLSSHPNFQNIPKEFDPIFDHEAKGKKLPKSPWKDLPALPRVRSYLVPFKGHVLIDRDYCFSPDTEVLTKDGFKYFQHLHGDEELAQWKNGEVTYAAPLELVHTIFNGNLINIVGQRSTDLLVTPNHECLLARDNFTIFARADEYPTGHFRQLHAGTYIGKYKVDHNLLALAVAIQADAAVKSSSICWKLKKLRKVERLHKLLNSLGLEFIVTTPPSAIGYSITYLKIADLPASFAILLDLKTKTFDRRLLEAAPAARLSFLQELSHWDGRRSSSSKHWGYFTTNRENADLVQEMAAVTGLRSVLHTQTLPSGKIFTTVAMRLNYATWTQTYTKTHVPYEGPVYCATMPHGTLVVRRNGRVMVTGNSQQELRILAHFDGGQLMDRYIADPWMDVHDYAQAELAKMGKHYDRKPVKNTNFGLVYGMGVGKLALKNDMPVDEAAALKKAVLLLYPGLKAMYQDMKLRAREHRPIRTWGGREYYCEEPKIVDGRVREFDYKMVNVLIQGSAADCTKEAIIRFNKVREALWFLILNVHDQLTVSVPKKDFKRAMQVLKDAMEGVQFDVPMLSEGAISTTHWGDLQDYDSKGKVL